MGIFPNSILDILEPTYQLKIIAITSTKLLTSPIMFDRSLDITYIHTMAVIAIPNHIIGLNHLTAVPNLTITSACSFDFRAINVMTNSTIIVPRAKIIPKNSKNNVVIGLPNICSLSNGMLISALSDSSGGNVSIAPIAKLYFPVLF